MKSIICLISSNYSISFIYVILVYISSVPVLSTPSCGLYGSPPCQFVPAPPGQTPTCARPGKTYCEHVDNYPTYLIKHLVHKWGYEAKNLLIDETWDDFAAVAWHETPVFYDPSFIFPQRPFTGNAHNFGGYSYETPSNGRGSGGKYSEGPYHLIAKQQQQQTTETPTFLLYSAAAQQQRLNKNHVTPYSGSPKISPNNPTLWLKRVSRDLIRRNDTTTDAGTDEDTRPASSAPPSGEEQEELKTASKRDTSLNMDLLEIVGVARPDTNAARVKRQAPGRSSLCQTTSQFITPQAALNNKGNWMFVVNEANTARQMVKAELCASNTCSNLCQLPNGYNSRCEQKFVQKRLIALQANGQNLYTDTFWFPSCCVCTISAN